MSALQEKCYDEIMLVRPAHHVAAFICLSLALVCPVASAQTARPVHPEQKGPVPWTPQSVDGAIAHAKQWLYSKQQPGGHWELDATRQGDSHAEYRQMQGDTFGGYTALATYALLAAGESPNNPRIKEAVEFLKTADIVGIYAIAMRCQVWLLIPHRSAQMRRLIHKDAEALFAGINDGSLNPKNKGMWDYLGRGPRLDHSVSQYGVLGLWACQQTGAIEVGADRWRTMESAWRAQQYAGGGWDYGPVGGERASMTAAGVASLFIIDDYLRAQEGTGCTGNPINPWIDKGLDWIDRNYDQIGINGYLMYGIERIGAASGYRFFGKRDWYNDLGRRLLNSQADDGSFVTLDYPGAQLLDATCFSLLFLARGRAPVMMNKLDYHLSSTGVRAKLLAAPLPTQPVTQPALVNWNERPRDLANLTAWTGRQLETYLQWQIVNLDVAPEDLHDAPLLYISGSDALTITDEYAGRLKAFIEQGGMAVANADCRRPEFSRSFEALGQEMFGRRFRDLPAGHPIFTHEQFPSSRWGRRPILRGLSNGVRELMLLIPDEDPARWWQVTGAGKAHGQAYELGADIYEYSNDRQPWTRGASYMVRLDARVKPLRRIRVARLIAGPNWDPEPGGWRRLAAVLHNEDQVDLDVFSAKPGAGQLAGARVAHLTGTTAFTLSAAAKRKLKAFVEHGGTLVVDAAGGAPAFADAAEVQLKELFGPDAPGLDQPLEPDDPVYQLPDHQIGSFTYRAWTRLHSVGDLKAPRLRAITIGNRPAVFFSREDLGAGLVGEPVDGIVGYSPATATQIMRNIILYSAPPEGGHPAK